MLQHAFGAPVDGLASPAYVVATPYDGVEPLFFTQLFRTGIYMAEVDNCSRGIVKDRNRLYWDQFKQLMSPCPPPDEQIAIVRFLDWATRQLDRAAHSKRKIITLLHEQRQAIIQRAVSRGLDTNSHLKSTGISWLGDIPKHWEVRRFRTITSRIEQGVSPLAAGFLADDTSWGVLKSGCVNRGVFRDTEHKRLATEFSIDPDIVVRLGDVLISRACGSPSLVGSVGRVKTLRYKLILSDKTFRAVFREDIDIYFIVLAMNSRYYRQQVEQAISGAEGMANNLPLSSLKDFCFALPPRDEAMQIAAWLEKETSRIHTIISCFERDIELLNQYRVRLIADIILGQLDVRAIAARLPQDSAISR